jgi:endonuclease YncB( thermonuclease family)
LDSPTDLKVVQGQTVVKEQILSDRSSARGSLTTQRQVLLLKLEQLKQPKTTSSSSFGSTEVTYAEEHAKIAQAKLEVEQANKASAQFLADSPWTDYAREYLNQRSEKEKLAQLEATQEQKQAALNLAIAQLQAAKEKHQQEVYKKQSQKDTSLEQAQVVTGLKSIESELALLGIVRSPYAGAIKKIKWLGQSDSELVAELTMAVDSLAAIEKGSWAKSLVTTKPDATKSTEVKNPTASTSPAASTPKADTTKSADVKNSVTTKPNTLKSAAVSRPVASTTKPDTTKSADKPKPDRRDNQTPNTNSRTQGFQSTWQVIGVHDGDTMKVRLGEKVERIRMACIDAPELKQELGKESRDHLKSLIDQNGDRVALKIVDTDRYGRRVALVFAGAKLLQTEQVNSGMAYVYEKYLNNCPDAVVVKQAEAIAQKQYMGVWSGSYQKPWDYRHSQR